MDNYNIIFAKAFEKVIHKVGVDTLKKTSLFARNAEILNQQTEEK